MSFDEFCSSLVERYLKDESNCCSERTIRTYYSKLNIEEAIIESTKSELIDKDEHYEHFNKKNLNEARNSLLRLITNFKACIDKDFLAVYGLVRGCTEGIVENLARLFWYDTSFRIASSYEINKEPEHVFIHRATELGAKALGINLRKVTNEKPFLPKKDFVRVSKAFDKLKPDQIESFLCIYRKDIENYMNNE